MDLNIELPKNCSVVIQEVYVFDTHLGFRLV